MKALLNMPRNSEKYASTAWLEEIQKKQTALRRKLINWFRKEARDLPWRQTDNPYAIWVSEIMLQQTQVATVQDYYKRFMQKFPTVVELAKAKDDQVMKLWEGLGYYSRARNLHKAARMIVEAGGKLPTTVAEWQSLPGVGRYTAGAIVSIAYGKAVPLLDGNVKRVLARIFAIEESIDETRVTKNLWLAAEKLVPKKSPGDFNQALMELGARVCVPRTPRCEQCPVSKECGGYQRGIQNQLPLRTPKKAVPHVEVVAAAIKKNGRYLLGKRPPKGMLGGLWEFPGGKVEEGESLVDAIKREIDEELGIGVEVKEKLISVNHAYTHLKVTIHLFLCEHVSGTPQSIYHDEIKWVRRSQFDQYAFPAANHKFLAVL